jgi:hypothetical protein
LPEIFRSRFSTGTVAPAKAPAAAPAKVPAAAPAKAPAATPADATATAPAAAAPAKAPAPAKKIIKRAAGYEPQKEVAALATTVGQLVKTVEAVAKAQPAAPAVPAEPVLNLDPSEERQLKVFAIMSELDPKYKELAANSKRFIAALPKFEEDFNAKYRADWEKKNKDDAFDNDREREDKYNLDREAAFEAAMEKERKKFGIDYLADDYRDAEVLHAQRRAQPKTEPQPDLEKAELLAWKRTQELAPVVAERESSASVDLGVQLSALDEALAGIVGEDGALSREALEALPASEYIAPVIEDAYGRSRRFAGWVTRAFGGDSFVPSRQHGESQADYVARANAEQNNRLSVFSFCQLLEKELQGQPDEQERPFVGYKEYLAMTPEEQAKHWTLTEEVVIGKANDEIAALAKQDIDKQRDAAQKFLTRHGVTTPLGKPRVAAPAAGAPVVGAAPAAAAATPAAPPKTVKPAIVSATDGTPVAPATVPDGGGFLKGRFGSRVIAAGVTA